MAGSTSQKTEVSKVRRELRESVRCTGLKGVQRAVNARDARLTLMWVIAGLFGLGMMTYYTWQICATFISREVITRISTQSGRPEFPDVSICNQVTLNSNPVTMQVFGFVQFSEVTNKLARDFYNGAAMKDFVRDSRAALQEEYGEEVLYNAVPSVASIEGLLQTLDIPEEFALIKYLKSLILYCSFQDWSGAEMSDVMCDKDTMRRLVTDGYNACATISLPEQFRDKVMSLTLILNVDEENDRQAAFYRPVPGRSVSRGVRLQIHPRATLPQMSKGRSIPVGQETTIKLNPFVVTKLGAPYSNCTERETLIDTEDTTNGTDGRKYAYSRSSCIGLCRQKNVIEKCGCVGNGLPFVRAQILQNKFCANFTNSTREIGPDGNIHYRYDINPDVIFAAIQQCACAEEARREQLQNGDCDVKCEHSCTQQFYTETLSAAPWPQSGYRLPIYRNYVQHKVKDLFNNYSAFERASQLFDAGDFVAAGAEVEHDTTLEENLLMLNVLLEQDKYIKYEDVPKTSLEDMVGSLGGIWNLWAGISFLTLWEILDLLFRLLLPRTDTRVQQAQQGQSPSNSKAGHR